LNISFSPATLGLTPMEACRTHPHHYWDTVLATSSTKSRYPEVTDLPKTKRSRLIFLLKRLGLQRYDQNGEGILIAFRSTAENNAQNPVESILLQSDGTNGMAKSKDWRTEGVLFLKNFSSDLRVDGEAVYSQRLFEPQHKIHVLNGLSGSSFDKVVNDRN
jgi:hypothetical protein